jgi:hypothetical protein
MLKTGTLLIIIKIKMNMMKIIIILLKIKINFITKTNNFKNNNKIQEIKINFKIIIINKIFKNKTLPKK